MGEERLYIVTYDIGEPRRWRMVFKLMNGFGDWLQLSVFQCRLVSARHAEMLTRLRATVSATEDHVLVIDLGPIDSCAPRISSIGKQGFAAVERKPVIV